MVDTDLELGRRRPATQDLQFGWVIGASMTTTILIVDDSKLARIVAGKAVSALQPDWQRVEAGNADEALELVGKTQIDVALLDFNMPGKNGVELAGELRLTRPMMPIALITANLQNEVIESARAVGATFVAKPVTTEGLQKFLTEAAHALSDQKA
jgi:CheY-like chemotaxis protein